MSNEQLPDIRRHPDGRWVVCWEPDRQHWRVFEGGTFIGSLVGNPVDIWRPVAILELPDTTDVDLPTLDNDVVQIKLGAESIRFGVWWETEGCGAWTHLSADHARGVAAHLLAAADAYERDSAVSR